MTRLRERERRAAFSCQISKVNVIKNFGSLVQLMTCLWKQQVPTEQIAYVFFSVFFF